MAVADHAEPAAPAQRRQGELDRLGLPHDLERRIGASPGQGPDLLGEVGVVGGVETLDGAESARHRELLRPHVHGDHVRPGRGGELHDVDPDPPAADDDHPIPAPHLGPWTTAWYGVVSASAMTAPRARSMSAGGRTSDRDGTQHELGEAAIEVVAGHVKLGQMLPRPSGTSGTPRTAARPGRSRGPRGETPRLPGPTSATVPGIFVPEDERRRLRGGHAVVQVVEIGVAEAARRDPDERLADTGHRGRDFGHLEGLPALVKSAARMESGTYPSFQMGVRFSRNAWSPSSGIRAMSSSTYARSAVARRGQGSMPLARRVRFSRWSVSRRCPQNVWAARATVAASCSSGTARLTIPKEAARGASNGVPRNMSSAAGNGRRAAGVVRRPERGEDPEPDLGLAERRPLRGDGEVARHEQLHPATEAAPVHLGDRGAGEVPQDRERLAERVEHRRQLALQVVLDREPGAPALPGARRTTTWASATSGRRRSARVSSFRRGHVEDVEGGPLPADRRPAVDTFDPEPFPRLSRAFSLLSRTGSIRRTSRAGDWVCSKLVDFSSNSMCRYGSLRWSSARRYSTTSSSAGSQNLAVRKMTPCARLSSTRPRIAAALVVGVLRTPMSTGARA